MRVGVMGAGAVGCYAGGLLAAAGMDVVFVGRGRIEAELRAHGLKLTDLDGRTTSVDATRINFSVEPSALADRDVVLVCVKSAQTEEVAKVMAPILRAEAMVISLQNGVRNPAMLRAHLGDRTVLGGIVAFNVVGLGNGVFRRATTGPLVIEAREDQRLRDLTRAFVNQGLEMQAAQHIEPLQWTKLIINLNNAISALSDLPTAQLLFDGEYRRILAATIAESISVLDSAKIPLQRLGPLPVKIFPAVLRLPTVVFRLVARAQLKIDPEARSSMWQDLAQGRNTEVDYLNGEIVRVAREHQRDAPLNRRIVELVHEVEAKKSGSPKLSAPELWRRISAA